MLGLVAVLVLLSSTILLPSSDAEAGVARGICDGRIEGPGLTLAQLTGPLNELDTSLHVKWVRLMVNWSVLEPSSGVYDDTQLATLDGVTTELSSRGITVILSIFCTPRWASDQSFWDSPPGVFAPGYQPFYPIKDSALDDLGRTGEFLAARYVGKVRAYECWNEPNLWPYIYPQQTASDSSFAASTYLKMLKAYSAGVRRGDASALVIAGATGPLGYDDAYRTSPQTFARYLSEHGAGQYFDAYSHHPYTPGGTAEKAPDQPPNDFGTTVTLYNLRQLLDIFPNKPFYLTEYGYNTAAARDFGGMAVTRVQQAKWLREAYAYAGRYGQVKVLFWFLVKDMHPAGYPSDYGVYTGLRELDGDRKPSWFVYAGGNRLTLDAPYSVRTGTSGRLSGVLTNTSVGELSGKTVALEWRRVGGGTWRALTSTKTVRDGHYHFWVRPASTRVYRVVWRGVVSSAKRTVRVY